MAILYDKESDKSEEPSKQEAEFWQQCKDLITLETPEQRQWFTQAKQKLTQAQKQGLIP